MENCFNGAKVKETIFNDLAKQIVQRDKKPHLAVFLVGNNPVCEKYVELKKKSAQGLGIDFSVYKFDNKDSEQDIIDCINFLNSDEEIDGIMIQIPVDPKFNRDTLIKSIGPSKDIDGLRYCLGLDSDFKPPVVEAILEALKSSNANLRSSRIAIVGHGFLVGSPLERALSEDAKYLTVADKSTENLSEVIKKADVIISATGKARLIKPEMLKDGVILIDAGTAEENGELSGDIDPDSYKVASYYTPVPGGIGPVTIAMLFKNLVRDN